MSWKAYEVADGVCYRLHLCQASSGLRSLRLVAVDSESDKFRSSDVFFATNAVPNDLLKRLAVESIARSVLLENGQPFYVDAHRMWLTESEMRQWSEDVVNIKWSTGNSPKFAER